MPGEPFVSIRKHIRWANEDATEDTSTLVLTSATGKFVDLRVYKPSSLDQPDLPDSDSLDRLEWGFAGQALNTPASASTPAHTVWTHWVDSRTTDAVMDEGDMWPLENGDVLEKGAMPRPGTGAVTEYEELWRDLDVADALRVSVVWVLDGRKGMVIRIGEWMEGIVRDEMGITVERWEWKGEKWQRIMRMGKGKLPCLKLCEGSPSEGSSEKVDGLTWTCVEDFKW